MDQSNTGCSTFLIPEMPASTVRSPLADRRGLLAELPPGDPGGLCGGADLVAHKWGSGVGNLDKMQRKNKKTQIETGVKNIPPFLREF